MKLLLLVVLLSIQQVAVATVFPSSRLARPLSGLVDKSSYLVAGTHRMVASGYALYSGQLPTLSQGPDDFEHRKTGEGHLFIFQDELAAGNRIFSRSIYRDRADNETATIHAEGELSPESGLVNIDGLIIFSNTDSDNNVWRLASGYRLQREGSTSLQVSDDPKDDTESQKLAFEKSKDYRIYRGQRDLGTIGNISVIVTETITINGYNPYVVYRHRVWRTDHSHIVGEELSVGTYSLIAIDPFKIEATVIGSYRSFEVGVRPTGSRLHYDFSDSHLTDGNHDERTTVELTMIENAKVWQQIDGNIGVAGSVASSRLIAHLRDKGNAKAARIALELDNELVKTAHLLLEDGG